MDTDSPVSDGRSSSQRSNLEDLARQGSVKHVTKMGNKLWGKPDQDTSRFHYVETDPGVVHPDSSVRLRWNMISIFLIIYTSIELPLDGKFIFGCFVDFFFVCDLVFNFFTGHYEDGELIMTRREIARHYFRGNFTVDFLATVPVDYIAFVSGQETSLLRTSRLFRVFRLFRLVRLFRLARLFRYARSYLEQFPAGYVRICKLVFLLLLFAHWNACMLFLVAYLEDFSADSWVARNDLEDSPVASQYTHSLFKALSHMLSIGYGRFAPILIAEVWTTMFSMLCGAALFSGIIGAVSTVLMTLDSAEANYAAHLNEVNSFMEKKAVPPELRSRIRSFLDTKWSSAELQQDRTIVLVRRAATPLVWTVFGYRVGWGVFERVRMPEQIGGRGSARNSSTAAAGAATTTATTTAATATEHNNCNNDDGLFLDTSVGSPTVANSGKASQESIRGSTREDRSFRRRVAQAAANSMSKQAQQNHEVGSGARRRSTITVRVDDIAPPSSADANDPLEGRGGSADVEESRGPSSVKQQTAAQHGHAVGENLSPPFWSRRGDDLPSWHKHGSVLRRRVTFDVNDSIREPAVSHSLFNEDQILEDLSPALRREIALHSCSSLIRRCPLFDPSIMPAPATAFIAERLRSTVCMEEDVVIHANDSPFAVYFVDSGMVEAMYNNELVARFDEGSYFGELPFLFGPVQLQPFEVVARTVCSFLLLGEDDFAELQQLFPEVVDMMALVARQRIVRMDLISEIPLDDADEAEQQVVHARERAHTHRMQVLQDLFERDQELRDGLTGGAGPEGNHRHTSARSEGSVMGTMMMSNYDSPHGRHYASPAHIRMRGQSWLGPRMEGGHHHTRLSVAHPHHQGRETVAALELPPGHYDRHGHHRQLPADFHKHPVQRPPQVSTDSKRQEDDSGMGRGFGSAKGTNEQAGGETFGAATVSSAATATSPSLEQRMGPVQQASAFSAGAEAWALDDEASTSGIALQERNRAAGRGGADGGDGVGEGNIPPVVSPASSVGPVGVDEVDSRAEPAGATLQMSSRSPALADTTGLVPQPTNVHHSQSASYATTRHVGTAGGAHQKRPHRHSFSAARSNASIMRLPDVGRYSGGGHTLEELSDRVLHLDDQSTTYVVSSRSPRVTVGRYSSDAVEAFGHGQQQQQQHQPQQQQPQQQQPQQQQPQQQQQQDEQQQRQQQQRQQQQVEEAGLRHAADLRHQGEEAHNPPTAHVGESHSTTIQQASSSSQTGDLSTSITERARSALLHDDSTRYDGACDLKESADLDDDQRHAQT